MKKWMKIALGIIGVLILLVIIDLICIFTINRPLFAIRTDNDGSTNIVYKGIFYDTYNCAEYSIPQIKAKGTKFTCAISRIDIGEIIEIKDTTKEIKDFTCAEALEEFYEDENYTYYWNCIKDSYMVVKYDSGYEETISNALKYGTIEINDLDNYNINYIKYGKEENNEEDLDNIYNNKITQNYTDIRNLSKNYTIEDAKKDNCFVIGTTIYNNNLYTEFMKKYNDRQNAFTRIVKTTIEGDLIINDVLYQDDKLILVKDNTRDEFSSKEDQNIKISEYKNIGTYEYNENLYWILYNADEVNDSLFESNEVFILATIN